MAHQTLRCLETTKNLQPEMEPGRPGHGSPGRRVNILGRVDAGHGSVSPGSGRVSGQYCRPGSISASNMGTARRTVRLLYSFHRKTLYFRL